MKDSALLPSRPDFDLDEFDLELNVAVTGDPNTPLAPVAAYTRITCDTLCQTTSIVTCATDGGTCCA
jgi:hypothetical protein